MIMDVKSYWIVIFNVVEKMNNCTEYEEYRLNYNLFPYSVSSTSQER